MVSNLRGTVALGAGSAATLTFQGTGLASIKIDESVLETLVENGGLIQADGGRVIMNAGAQHALLASVVNNTGVIEARTLQEHNGTITLLGSMSAGSVNVAGTLDASAPNGGKGGFIETSAAHVQVADSARVTTLAASGGNGLSGTWLIDPTDYTIAANDPNNGSSYMSNTALSNGLVNGNMVIQTSATGTGNGDIFVADAVTWSGGNSLTLNAIRDVKITAIIKSGSGDNNALGGNVSIVAGRDILLDVGATINTTLNGGDISLIAMGGSVTVNGEINAGVTRNNATGGVGGHILLRADGNGGCLFNSLECSTVNFGLQGKAETTETGRTDIYYNPVSYSAANPYVANITGTSTAWMLVNDVGVATAGTRGFQAISTNLGGNYALGIKIDAGVTSTWNNGAGFVPIGILGNGFTGTFDGRGLSISNLVINLPDIANTGLFGYAGAGSVIQNVGLIGGSIVGGGGSGALVGNNATGIVNNSYATGTVNGGAGSGGLVGSNTTGTISNSYATGAVSGGAGSGGLLGSNTTGTISNSYATGAVSGGAGSGGLLGSNVSGVISHNSATGNVTGGAGSGGLIGSSTSGPVSNSYATGKVNGGAGSGGLVGSNTSGGINDSYAMGKVIGEAGSSSSTPFPHFFEFFRSIG